MRLFTLKDASGAVVPGSYIVAMEYALTRLQEKRVPGDEYPAGVAPSRGAEAELPGPPALGKRRAVRAPEGVSISKPLRG